MKKHAGQKNRDKSCQSNLDKRASNFGSFYSYLITTILIQKGKDLCKGGRPFFKKDEFFDNST